jgi:hypothetical protein
VYLRQNLTTCAESIISADRQYIVSRGSTQFPKP